MMGSVIPPTDRYNFRVLLSNDKTDAELAKVEVIGEQGVVLAMQKVSGHHAEVSVSVQTQSKYYFLKVYQEDGKYAATTPVWVE